MPKKEQVIDVTPIIATPALYEVEIQGVGGLLMNKLPDLSISKAEKKEQAKIDPVELERRTWREKLYFSPDIGVYVPGENIHECLKEGCRYWGQRIPGEGQKTYTDVVAKAVVVEDMPLLGIKSKEDGRIVPFGKAVNGTPSKGKRSGAKVYKIRPLIQPWGGKFKMHVFDARLTEAVLRTILNYAGTFIGLCDWRPTFGRFGLVKLERVN